MNTAPTRPPEKLPDPWLFDSEALLRELDRCRELVLDIPISNPNATHFGINVAVTALWNLQDNLRHLLQLHRQGQSAWVKTHQAELQRSLQEIPIQGAAGMEKRRKVREFQNRIVNLQEQLALLQRQMAQDGTAHKRDESAAQAKLQVIRT